MSSNYLLLADLHLADNPPASRREGYLDEVLALLWQSVELAKHHEAVAVWAGDVFHIKTPGRNSFKMVNQVIDIVKAYPRGLYIVPGNHDLCVSQDTEALTDLGWKQYKDLTGSEKFAVLDEITRELTWERPRAVHASFREGEMILFANNRVNHLVTPSHSLYTRRRSSYSNTFKYQLKKASQAPSYPHWQAVVGADEWVGIASDLTRIPRSASGRVKEHEVLTADLAELAGWYLSEGSTEQHRVTISQSRTANASYYKEISHLVERMGYCPREHDPYIRVGNTALADYLGEQFGRGSYNKKIPAWVKNWPKELLAMLMQALLKGDAHKQSDTNYVLTTASDSLIDDVQEICIKLGWRANSTARQSFPVNDGSGYAGTARRLLITLKSYTLLPLPKRVPYAGIVWCPDFGGKVWMSRREGKPIWTGNSHDRLDSLPSQPLGMLFKAGAVMAECQVMMDDGHPVFGVPWLQRHTDEAVTTALHDWREYGTREEHALVVTHAPLYPPGRELKYEFYDTHKWAAAMGYQGSVFYGHVHNPHGVYNVDGVQFCNNGALSRGSLDESNLKRDVVATMWSSINGEFRTFPLAYQDSSDIFRMEEKTKREAQVKLDDFLESIGQASLDITTTSSVMDHIRGLDLGPEVERFIQDLLQSVEV